MAYDIVDLPDDQRAFSFQNVLFEEFTVKQIRSPRARDGEFIPFSVMQGDREVWSFMTHPKPPGFSGLVLLREVGDELVLMLANKRELYEVIPVRDLPNRKTIGGEAIGGRNLADLLAIKEMVANNEDLRPVWTKRELALWEAFKNRLSEQRQSARAEETRRKQADQAKRLTERKERQAEILSRRHLFVYTKDGQRRHGYPVVGDEWQCLPKDTFCVAVTSYDQETQEVGDVLESFVIRLEGSSKVPRSVAPVTKEKPQPTRQAPVLRLDFKIVPINGDEREVFLVDDMAAVRSLAKAGLTDDTFAMCPKAGDEGRYAVFALTKGKAVPVTEVKRK